MLYFCIYAKILKSGCKGGKRIVYVEEGEKCIIHIPNKADFSVQNIIYQIQNDTVVNITESNIDELDNFNETLGPQSFVYFDEYMEICNEVSLSYTILAVTIGGLVLALGIAIFAVVMTCRYKKKYYELLDTKGTEPKELKEIPSIQLQEPEKKA